MKIGIPKEIKADEYRVGMTPPGVALLKSHGHEVYVQRGAGEGCRISNEEYVNAGAELIEDARNLYGLSDMVVKVKEPQDSEYDLLKDSQILFAYLHLAPAVELTASLLKNRVTAVAYETIQMEDGSLPLLIPMSEVAGRMAVQIGAHFLEKPHGGRGILLGGVPGVHRGKVTVLGAGTVGQAATKIAIGMGADVTTIDLDQSRLRMLDDLYGNRITTVISSKENIWNSVVHSHLVIGSVLIPGARAPRLVTRDMIKEMKAGSVIVDVSIDQGGCIETSRPTTHRNPTFVVDDVLHYCVPNMPGAVARTSTFALTNITLPYVLKLADQGGIEQAVTGDAPLAKGVNCYKGHVTYEQVAEALNYDYRPLNELVYR
jgi:alanine dehydrogenase